MYICVPISVKSLKIEINFKNCNFNSVVLKKFYFTGAYIDLQDIKMVTPLTNPTSSNENIQSDAIFAAIDEQIKLNPNLAKTVDAVFLYIITIDGKTVAEWSK